MAPIQVNLNTVQVETKRGLIYKSTISCHINFHMTYELEPTTIGTLAL